MRSILIGMVAFSPETLVTTWVPDRALAPSESLEPPHPATATAAHPGSTRVECVRPADGPWSHVFPPTMGMALYPTSHQLMTYSAHRAQGMAPPQLRGREASVVTSPQTRNKGVYIPYLRIVSAILTLIYGYRRRLATPAWTPHWPGPGSRPHPRQDDRSK